mgnify:CR=1 FL=1
MQLPPSMCKLDPSTVAGPEDGWASIIVTNVHPFKSNVALGKLFANEDEADAPAGGKGEAAGPMRSGLARPTTALASKAAKSATSAARRRAGSVAWAVEQRAGALAGRT